MKLKATVAAGALAAATLFAGAAPAQAQSEPFIAQLVVFGGNFCPRGWTPAEGQLLAISQYSAVFSLVGTTYGGDGRTTFGVPDMRGRSAIGYGSGPGLPTYAWGQRGGTTSFTLSVAQMPSHNHTGTVAASPATADTNQPVRNSFAASPAGTSMYLDGAPAINNMHSDTLRIQNTGGGQAVNKVSPYLAMRWCFALTGIFPSRN